MLDAKDLALVTAIARLGTLARAARALDMTVAGASKRLSSFEAKLGTRLFDRTTRRVTATPDGEALVTEARGLLDRMADLEARLAGRRRAPAGHLRVNSTLGYGRRVLAPLLSEFARIHTDITLELTLTQGLPVGAEPPFDVAIRLGESAHPNYSACHLAENRRVLAAAPRYLRAAGTPRTPHDLTKHRCLVVRESDIDLSLWALDGAQGKVTIRVHPALASNDGESVTGWAIAGHGILLRSEWDIASYLADGRLLRVLPAYGCPAHVHALWPSRSLPLRTRVFVDFLVKSLHRESAELTR